MENEIGIIVQARTGSTRLPNKVLLPFFQNLSILDLILRNLKDAFGAESIVLATSVSDEDESIAALGAKYGVRVHRGSEQNVLSRFIEAAELAGFERVIRVCADNPLISMEGIKRLMDHANESDADYLSFKMSAGNPVILSHIGLFAEFVTTDALKKVANSTDESIYLEHVTNYIYQRPEQFNVTLVDLPNGLGEKSYIRLTCDTREDFELLQEIYAESHKEDGLNELIELIEKREDWLVRMELAIEQNRK